MQHAGSSRAHTAPVPPIIARSAPMTAVLAVAARAGASNSKVLITGESGVGKDLVAQYVHAASRRSLHPFVSLNCGGLAEGLLESELFGHARGSFTGAYRDKIGKLQLADRGTIFLDEVGEMTPRMQALLLRFLETGEIQQVGGDSVQYPRVDVRVIAATNRNLTRMVAGGQFRDDLFYRLRVVHLHVPPLRQRVADIRPILEHFLNTCDGTVTLTDPAWRAVEEYAWPGNVRELHNFAEQLAALPFSGALGVSDLPHLNGSAVEDGSGERRDRRRRRSDDLFERLTAGTGSFWDDVHNRFMDHDLTRADVRELVTRGLRQCGGCYRELLRLFGMPAGDYKRTMSFLSRHDCCVDFRPYRAGANLYPYPAPIGTAGVVSQRPQPGIDA